MSCCSAGAQRGGAYVGKLEQQAVGGDARIGKRRFG